MFRGTTPTNIFETDLDLTAAEVVFVTYKQFGGIVLELEKDDLTIEADKITAKLTQAQTLKFRESCGVEVQIRAKFSDGTAVASNIISTTAERILKDGEI